MKLIGHLFGCSLLSLLMLTSPLLLPTSLGAAPEAKPLLVLRYRDPATGVHAFTTDQEPARRLPLRFARETVPNSIRFSPSFYLYTQQYGATVPVYRFRAPDGSMLFAANQNERSLLTRRFEQVDPPVFIYDREVEGSSEVFRLANPASGDLVYTTSPDERVYYLSQGWTQLSSLGFAQSTSSSGTGILRDTTVKLEGDDLAHASATLDRGQRIIFEATNAKTAALQAGTILYAERSSTLPLGLVAKIVAVTHDPNGGLEIDTQPVELREAFVEFHIYLHNCPAINRTESVG